MSDQNNDPVRSLREMPNVRAAVAASVPNATAVMTRAADALHRLERLAEAMEKAAAEGEKQLAVIRGRL